MRNSNWGAALDTLQPIHRISQLKRACLFREAGGAGQEALFRISKAYSVYDSEVGYCQGQSFLIAALLLQVSKLSIVTCYET